MLCEKCSQIHFRRLQKCGLSELRLPEKVLDKSHDQDSSVYYFHFEVKWALKASGEDGCHFCGMIWERLFAAPFFRHYSPKSFAGKYVYLLRTWLDKWIEEYGPDALEREENVIAYCEDRCAYSSNFSNLAGWCCPDTKVTAYSGFQTQPRAFSPL
jgi:hypothetical protein